ncbi:MAG: DUF3330 domain-containing protein [Propionivibrio sp.]
MTAGKIPQDVEPLVCETCLKEIPATEAVAPEAVDYVVHFCGLDCYEKWKKSQPSGPKDKGGDKQEQ